jgi:putative tricarboxylic transport membrane protein
MTDLPATTSPYPSEPPPPGDEKQQELTFWQRWGEMAMAAGVLALGIIVLVETQDIRIRQGVVVSPRIFPTIVGTGLVLVAIWYAIDIIRGPHVAGGGEDAEDVDPEAETDWLVLGIIAVGLVVYAALMATTGFILASATLFTISSFAMGNPRLPRNIVVGLALGTVIFVLFDGWLGVRLPTGWLEELVQTAY